MNILLLFDPRGERQTYKMLAATGDELHFVRDGEDPLELARNARLLIIDVDSQGDDGTRVLRELSQRPDAPPVLVITTQPDRARTIDLFGYKAVTNVIVRTATDAPPDNLVVTVQKILRGDLFGLEKYLSWGCRIQEEKITSSAQKEASVAKLAAYLATIGCNSRLATLAEGVADELLTNAIYNAPVDEHGVSKYASQSRAERVNLGDNEHVRFRCACDGTLLALSCEDNFGRLQRETVVDYLRKCFMKGSDQVDSKKGGAGLGLYHAFESLNQMIINVNPGKRTEVIGILDISGSYRDFAKQPKSLNIFMEGARP